MEDKIGNSIASHQQTINELKELKHKIQTSETEKIRFRIETKHWYGYGLDMSLSKEKSILDLSEYTMLTILNEAIEKVQKSIDKLIDIEIVKRSEKSK